MEKFASLEFGKSGQTATPIIRAVVKETENEVVKIMSDVYQKEAGL